jgi:tRNA(fMet)-specific endonuclease VapC
MYVLDTNTLIYFFKDMGNVSRKMFQHPLREIAIPAIALFELEVGIQKSVNPQKRIKQLQTLTSRVNTLHFGPKEAFQSAKVRAFLEKKGMPIAPYDLLIAGTTLAQNGILVTRNIGEFTRVPGLRLENWFD